MSQTFSRWTCWLCGATHGKNGARLNTGGFSRFNHLRQHVHEGHLRRSTAYEQVAGEGPFMVTDAGRSYLAARESTQPEPQP